MKVARDPVFLDTAALVALVNRDDSLHSQAADLSHELTIDKVPLVTSEWVLLELLNSVSKPPARQAGLALVGALQSSRRTDIVPASSRAWNLALDYYAQRPDKGWSFVDCTSILICQSRSIRRVLTHDRHFQQAGFETLMRDS